MSQELEQDGDRLDNNKIANKRKFDKIIYGKTSQELAHDTS
jgi:hypothetical protein